MYGHSADEDEINEHLETIASLHEKIEQLEKAAVKHAAFVTHVRVACTCLSAPLFLDQEGKSDVHTAARQTLKYLREAIEKDQGEQK